MRTDLDFWIGILIFIAVILVFGFIILYPLFSGGKSQTQIAREFCESKHGDYINFPSLCVIGTNGYSVFEINHTLRLVQQ